MITPATASHNSSCRPRAAGRGREIGQRDGAIDSIFSQRIAVARFTDRTASSGCPGPGEGDDDSHPHRISRFLQRRLFQPAPSSARRVGACMRCGAIGCGASTFPRLGAGLKGRRWDRDRSPPRGPRRTRQRRTGAFGDERRMRKKIRALTFGRGRVRLHGVIIAIAPRALTAPQGPESR